MTLRECSEPVEKRKKEEKRLKRPLNESQISKATICRRFAKALEEADTILYVSCAIMGVKARALKVTPFDKAQSEFRGARVPRISRA